MSPPPPPPPPPPQPTHPIPASTLLSHYSIPTALNEQQERIKTGYREVDEQVLEGGFVDGRGGVVGFAGEGAEDLVLSTLTHHLLASRTNTAFFIDTLGSFPAYQLQKSLIRRAEELRKEGEERVKHSGGFVYGRARDEAVEGGARHELVRQADEAMERVAVMRVFDFAGIMEAVGEVGEVVKRKSGEGVRGGDRSAPWDDEEVATGTDGRAEDGLIVGDGTEVHESIPEPLDAEEAKTRTEMRKVIADSQAEDDEVDNDEMSEDDEMLDQPNDTSIQAPQNPPPTPPAQHDPPTNIPNPPSAEPADLDTPVPSEPSRTLLILSSLPRVISPLMRQNHVRGHALLVHLMRTLRSLTITSAFPGGLPRGGLCCLILNSTVGGTQAWLDKSSNAVAGTTAQEADEGVSIFAENGTMRPALGKTFAHCLDLSIMVSRIGGGGKEGKRVLEVVSDRYEGRVGRWCVVDEVA